MLQEQKDKQGALSDVQVWHPLSNAQFRHRALTGSIFK